jgi:predicted metal-dependent hydrolase
MALSRLFFSGPKRSEVVPPLPIEIVIDGTVYLVHLRGMSNARRMVMRLARDGGSFTMSVPLRQSRKRAVEFVETSREWMRKALIKSGPRQLFTDGTEFPLRGETVRIAATGRARGLVNFDAPSAVVHVPGAPEHLKRKLTDWLKKEAQRDFEKISTHYAAAMQVSFKKLVVRDQKSRWGSCTSDGTLSYSWRLILAPPYVLDYVCAHEVAHLREMNHSPRFWRLVLAHCKNARMAKQWLKKNGQSVHRFG